MSLPEKPLTRRETYLAKAAGQAVTLPETDLTREEQYLRAIAEGGGGGVTPEYVAEAIAEAKTDIEAEIPTKTSDLTNNSGYAAIDDTTAAQDKAYSSAKVEEKVAGEEITATATGTDLTLSTSSGNLNALTVYGKSEVVDGAIISAGEGWATVDLGTLNWNYDAQYTRFTAALTGLKISATRTLQLVCPLYQSISDARPITQVPNKSVYNTATGAAQEICIHDTSYTDATAFKNSLNGVILAYQLADPTQGNTIAIKTDDGTGVDGTMAVFETGTPLRGIPDTTVRDVMAWDGSAGTVTKKCSKVKLVDLTWTFSDQLSNQNRSCFYVVMTNMTFPASTSDLMPLICNGLTVVPQNLTWTPGQVSCQNQHNRLIVIVEPTITTEEQLKTQYAGLEFIYGLATPTTEQLTAVENASIAGLRTFEPQTHAQNNAQTDMMVEAYANTANGKAVNELKQDVQSEISALKITQSATLTLTVADWTNNTQTVTYAHDTAKRNVIDVDLSSVEEWASCGVLATAETASGITFSCKTVPENALNFRVTSMGVN